MILLLCTVFVILVTWWTLSVRQPPNFPSGPRLTLPFIGDGLAVGESAIDGLEKLRQKYGNVFGLYLGSRRIVVVSDYDLIQEIGNSTVFQGRNEFLSTSGLRARVADGAGGTTSAGLVFSSGPTWQEQRRFTLHRLRDLGFGKRSMEALISEEVSMFCKHLAKYNGESIDVKNDFDLAVVNSLWTVVGNERLSYDDSNIRRLSGELHRFLAQLGSSGKVLLLMNEPLTKLLKVLNIQFSFPGIKELAKWCELIVSKHEETFQEESPRDFTDLYLQEMSVKSAVKQESSFTGLKGRVNLIETLVDLFMAGSDTTSSSFCWSMLFMVLHQDFQAKVQAELDLVTGRSRLPCYDDKDKTPFTNACLLEIQRCGNILPLSIFHTATQDAWLGGRYFIPKGTDLQQNLGCVMNDPKYFKDPEKFDPYRHLNKDSKFDPHPMVFPFGIGKRRCLGEPMAKMSLYLFFTGILSTFTVDKDPSDHQLSPKPSFGGINAPKAFKLAFKPRN